MHDDTDSLVRSDRVGLYVRSGWEGKMPIWAPEYGDLWLTHTGRVGFTRVNWMGTNWETTLPEISDVREVSRATALRCYQGAIPRRLIEMTANNKRYIVFFTGIVKFRSKAENLIAHIPGVHHAGALAVELKSGWDNRGTGERGRDARQAWWDLLTSQTNRHELSSCTEDAR
jgi:hypothetical protein